MRFHKLIRHRGTGVAATFMEFQGIIELGEVFLGDVEGHSLTRDTSPHPKGDKSRSYALAFASLGYGDSSLSCLCCENSSSHGYAPECTLANGSDISPTRC